MNAGSHRRPFLWVLLIIACSAAPALQAKETIVNQDPAFTLKLPEVSFPARNSPALLRTTSKCIEVLAINVRRARHHNR